MQAIGTWGGLWWSAMGSKLELLPKHVPAAAGAQSPLDGENDPRRGPELARLITRAQQGDTGAFESLIAMVQPKVFGFARAYSRDPSDAADLAQEALLKVYRALGGFRFQSSLLTWMFRIVRNCALDHQRSRESRERKRQQPLELASERALHAGDIERREAGPEERLLREQARQAVWAALGRVPEVYRAVVVLVDMQGLTYEEVATIVEAPVGTVRSRLFRGREALREVLLADASETLTRDNTTADVPASRRKPA